MLETNISKASSASASSSVPSPPVLNIVRESCEDLTDINNTEDPISSNKMLMAVNCSPRGSFNSPHNYQPPVNNKFLSVKQGPGSGGGGPGGGSRRHSWVYG